MKTLKVFSLAALCISALTICLWYVAVPEELIVAEIQKTARRPVEVIGLKKGLFFNASINSINVTLDKRTLAVLQNIELAFNPLYIFTGKIPVEYKSDIFKGIITGTAMYNLRLPDADRLTVAGEFTGLRLVELIELYDTYGDGSVSGTLTVKEKEVHIDFIVKDYKPKIRGVTIPDMLLAYFDELSGKLMITGGNITTCSIALKGLGIFARVKWQSTERASDMTIELMPEPSFKGMEVIKTLKRYETSPGIYTIRQNNSNSQ
ncbi:hypothetical protein [Candidatus Magnetominusculus xianensis]|uniref:Type II secretion system protein GspN n=1 Tax=Candidatus Magnetominusculus xianensis TaxID=1748249 RepID=A0ABR5SM72_9BACT|nr:hypothetical protein [Candidatus Magnetominusculus xianensis]KWT92664.1 type II secretion system protein GspN [Candidatus Magnetominusculus xianensis]MBF0403785.1 hypothetical protein [Nitrospirota bacterium]